MKQLWCLLFNKPVSGNKKIYSVVNHRNTPLHGQKDEQIVNRTRVPNTIIKLSFSKRLDKMLSEN